MNDLRGASIIIYRVLITVTEIHKKRDLPPHLYICCMDLKTIVGQYNEQYLPHLSVDTVIFGYQDSKLHCLLLKFGDRWFLPGGHIEKDEDVKEAARRVVKTRTSLSGKFLHFFNVFGGADRNFSNDFKQLFENKDLPLEDGHPMLQRYVTLGFISLVRIDDVQPLKGNFDDDITWYPVDELPDMVGDHAEIIQNAIEYLIGLNDYSPIGHHLLPHFFTMPQLHKLTQIISRRELDRSRFQKKMLSLDIYKRHEEITTSVRGRNPYLYSYEGPNNLERI